MAEESKGGYRRRIHQILPLSCQGNIANLPCLFLIYQGNLLWNSLHSEFVNIHKVVDLCFVQDFSDEKPLAWSHFTAEGDVEFKAVLFVPPKAPQDLYESYYNANKSNLKLYVRRVFISDEFNELLPKYLNFLLVGIVVLCYCR